MKTRDSILFISALLLSASAFSQDKKPNVLDPCQLVAEEIIPLRVPNFDQAAMWKRMSGVKGIERPRALLPVVDGGQIAIGTSVAYDERKEIKSPPTIQMLRTNKLGKVVVEEFIPLKGLTTVNDAILLKDKVVVLTQMGEGKNESIGLAFLNGAGVIKSTKTITDPSLRLIPKSIVSVTGGAQMIIAAEAISKRNENDAYSVLIWVDKDGNKIVQKEYLPGVKNKPEFVGRLGASEIVMTGRAMTEDGRDAGWVLRLSPKGDIIYQRPYARGGDSVIRRAVALPGGGMVVVGDALPAVAGDKAAWVMRLDKVGEPVWQKYLTGTYSYSGLDVLALGDGRLNVLTAGKPVGEGGRQYARVVTISMDGVVIGDESFIEGSNAIPARIIEQNNHRYLLGMAETGFANKDVTDDLKYITYDTWLLGLSALPEFKNTCAAAPDRTLDDLP